MTELSPTLEDRFAREPAGTGQDAPPARQQPPRTLTQQLFDDILRRWTARLGLAWVGVLVACAVFAPFIANSHPYLIRTAAGSYSSPLLAHLTPADVTVLSAALAAVIAFFMGRRLGFRNAVLVVLGVAVLAGIISNALILKRYTLPQTYREQMRDGQITWALHAPIAYSPGDRQRDQTDVRLKAPSATHIMGTTGTGADLAANMIHATRIALSIGFISTGIAIVIGVTLGGLMGYYGGLVDLFGMRIMEIFSAIPTLLLLLCFVAVFTPNLYMMMVIIGLTSWEGYATFTRAEYLSLRQRDFVQAAIAAGLPLRSVLFKHMLPNGVAPVLISASFGVAGAILAESTLSFLGIGLGVDEASWGKLLADARSAGGTFYWWLAIFPGGAIFLTVFAYNLIGEALRDAIDPRTRGT